MNVTAYQLAERWVGTLGEVKGVTDNPFILGMLKLDQAWPTHDEVPWCSAFLNFIAWQLRLPRSKSLAARSWLTVGTPVDPVMAVQGFDIVILKRGDSNAGPNVINAPGHVGLYSSRIHGQTFILGGNQGDNVSVAPFNNIDILGVRRLAQL